MQLFEVLKSVETKEIHGESLTSLIDPSKAYLITDDLTHTIYSYIGPQATWVYHLLVDHLAKEIRSHMATVYQIEPVTEEIWNSWQNISLDSQGVIPSIINPDLYDLEELNLLLQKTKAVQLRIDTAWREHLQPEDILIFRKIKPSEVLDLVKHQEIPSSYEREMILINSSIYSSQSSLLSFLPKRKIIKQLNKLGEIPEGSFFFEEYTPRIFIRKGRVNAIELFHKRSMHSDFKKSAGTINYPVLPFPRIQKENNFDFLVKAFHRPPKESLESFLARQE
ncbi:MAG: hypothetical protein DRO88_05855 [Promethearchaeia archaeon]|nr:MAG: hypothetical protein DRO88_05855 [Candidatus Lokiarchaeia archaeon]